MGNNGDDASIRLYLFMKDGDFVPSLDSLQNYDTWPLYR
jgi:hypothetical protein